RGSAVTGSLDVTWTSLRGRLTPELRPESQYADSHLTAWDFALWIGCPPHETEPHVHCCDAGLPRGSTPRRPRAHPQHDVLALLNPPSHSAASTTNPTPARLTVAGARSGRPT